MQEGFVKTDYAPSGYFAVRITSDELTNAHIPKGAILILQKQRQAVDGDIVLAVHNGKVVFRYYKPRGERLYLTAAHNDILPIAVEKDDDLLVLGKVKEIRFEV